MPRAEVSIRLPHSALSRVSELDALIRGGLSYDGGKKCDCKRVLAFRKSSANKCLRDSIRSRA